MGLYKALLLKQVSQHSLALKTPYTKSDELLRAILNHHIELQPRFHLDESNSVRQNGRCCYVTHHPRRKQLIPCLLSYLRSF